MDRKTCVRCAWEHNPIRLLTYCNYHRRKTTISTLACEHFEDYMNPVSPLLVKLCDQLYQYLR